MNSGRLTCIYKITGTDTFRLAASKMLDFYGTNLQNCSDSLMRCVIPEDGNIFIQPDQSGAEALIVAMETRPGKFRRLFDLGIKVHSYMALQIFTDKFRNDYPASRYKNVEPDTLASYPEFKSLMAQIKNSPKEYDLGKRVIHAKNYNMGPRTFQLNVLELSEGSVVLSFKESKEFLATHEVVFPEIIEWQARIKGEAAATRMLRNLFGYPRIFEHIWNDELERQLFAFVPQSTVGTITNLAYTELFQRIKQERLPWKLLGNKHDSLLLECPESHQDQAIAYCKQHMARELTSSRGEIYQMKVGISVAKGNWGKYHKETNPYGMKEVE